MISLRHRNLPAYWIREDARRRHAMRGHESSEGTIDRIQLFRILFIPTSKSTGPEQIGGRWKKWGSHAACSMRIPRCLIGRFTAELKSETANHSQDLQPTVGGGARKLFSEQDYLDTMTTRTGQGCRCLRSRLLSPAPNLRSISPDSNCHLLGDVSYDEL